MPANNNPIFPLTPNVGIKTLATQDTSTTTPTTQGAILLTAGANGTRLDAIVCKALGTNVQTVLRVFVNDGGGVLAANFSLIAEYTLPATTAIATAATTNIILKPLDSGILLDSDTYVLPPYLKTGHKIYLSIGTTVATGWTFTVIGADY